MDSIHEQCHQEEGRYRRLRGNFPPRATRKLFCCNMYTCDRDNPTVVFSYFAMLPSASPSPIVYWHTQTRAPFFVFLIMISFLIYEGQRMECHWGISKHFSLQPFNEDQPMHS